MAPPPLTGPPTPEMQEKLWQIRVCVIGIFIAAVGRLATGDVPLSELMCVLNGVFLLREDQWLVSCYACLANSPLGQCVGPQGGGIACLKPFLFVAAFNCVFLALRLFYGGPFMLVSFCFQSAGAMVAWKLNGLINDAAGGSELGMPGFGQPLAQPLTQMRMFNQPGADGVDGGGGGSSGAPGGGGGPSGGGASGPRNDRGGFVAFQGSGQRLSG